MILGSETKDSGSGIRDSVLRNHKFEPWKLDSGPGFRILTLETRLLTLKIGILTLDIRIRGSISWDFGSGILDSRLRFLGFGIPGPKSQETEPRVWDSRPKLPGNGASNPDIKGQNPNFEGQTLDFEGQNPESRAGIRIPGVKILTSGPRIPDSRP